MTQYEKVKLLAKTLDMKKARNITAVDLNGATIAAECFVICTAGSPPQMRALYEAACEQMAKNGCPPEKTEGVKNNDWIVVDFGGVMLHIFSNQMRDFYGLDNLWADALPIDIKTTEE